MAVYGLCASSILSPALRMLLSTAFEQQMGDGCSATMQSKYMGVTQDGLPCDPFDVPPGSICINNPLPTPWSADVDPNNPWPEYPRPQMSRERWQNLNGIWEFEPYG